MKIYVHKETDSISREPKLNPDHGYTETDFASEYSEYLHLRFDHFEPHRSSVTCWFREFHYDEWNDSFTSTDRLLPMRIAEFQKLLLQGRDMLYLEGFFGFRKIGTSVSLEFRAEGYGV